MVYRKDFCLFVCLALWLNTKGAFGKIKKKKRGDGMKMKVKIISLAWMWSENREGGKFETKIVVEPT